MHDNNKAGSGTFKELEGDEAGLLVVVEQNVEDKSVWFVGGKCEADGGPCRRGPPRPRQLQ